MSKKYRTVKNIHCSGKDGTPRLPLCWCYIAKRHRNMTQQSKQASTN